MSLNIAASSLVPGGYGFTTPPPYNPSSTSNWRRGQFAFLKWQNVANWEHRNGQMSMIRQYTHLGEGAAKHPLCVIGVIDKYLACVQGTSFNGTPIQDKCTYLLPLPSSFHLHHAI